MDWRSLDTCRGATASTFCTQALGILRYCTSPLLHAFSPPRKSEPFFTQLMYHYHRNTPIPPLRSPSTLSNYHLSFTWIYHLIPHSNPSVTSYSGELHVRMLRKCNRWTHTDFCRLCSQRQREFQARRIVVDSKPYQRIQKGVSRGDQSTGSAWNISRWYGKTPNV